MRFLASAGGRVGLVTLGVGLAALAALALAGPGHALDIIAAVPPFLIVGGILCVGLSVADHGGKAMGMLIGLPFVGGPYLALMHAAPRLGTGAGIGFALLAAAALWVSIAPAAVRRAAHA